jgi:cytochrome c553
MKLGERLGLLGWLTAAGVALAAFVVGFLWLPSLKEGAQVSLWDAFCRAAGIERPVRPALLASADATVPTTVAWSVETRHSATSGDAQRGKTLAATCAGCHGAQGVSATEMFPNLAGLSAEVVYKQLDDYRTGKRQNPIMQGMAAALDDQKVADLAAYFATLPRNAHSTGTPAPSLVVTGNPMRSIAPCGACHGPMGFKDGAPALEGQKRAYLKTQLEAFATGARHNDINQQMREIARALTAAERESVADWYGNPEPQ